MVVDIKSRPNEKGIRSQTLVSIDEQPPPLKRRGMLNQRETTTEGLQAGPMSKNSVKAAFIWEQQTQYATGTERLQGSK